MSTTNKIVERIQRQVGDEGLVEKLASRLSATDLQSLLIEVYHRRAEALTPRNLVEQYGRDLFVQPSAASPVALLDFDRLAYSLLPEGFEPVELSPLAPLGNCSVVSPLSQNMAIPTIRNTEVCSDSTNVLALECARRRRQLQLAAPRSTTRIRLCTSQRLVRPQRFDAPGTFQHFRLFCLCSAGRDEGSFRFETDALAEQISFYLRLFEASRQLGYKFEDMRVSLTAWEPHRVDALQINVIAPLKGAHPRADVGFDQVRKSGSSYYAGVGFQIHSRDREGHDFLLVDGGFTTWTQQLLSNRKERLLISGLGTERLAACFRN
jgi:hypothetical protein